MANLTAMEVRNLKPGPKTKRYGDGRGLYLVVRANGSKAWVQRTTIDGDRTDIGLGGYPDVSLALARKKSAEIRTAVAEGRDPRAERRQPNLPTFREAAEQYVSDNALRWKNPKEAVNWRGCLHTYAYPVFGTTRIDRITRADVLDMLLRIWLTKPSIARKLRQRVRAIFAAAMAFGYLDINPAGEVIDAALPRTPAVKAHFRALPYQDVPETLDKIEASTASLASRLCFRFLVLTAARSGEARGARWDEIDLGARTWTIPASRMKSGRQHRVPLSDAALEVLRRTKALDDNSGLVFPSLYKPGRELSDMTLTKLLRDNGLAKRATVHGFRTSFKTWCMETTDTPWAVGEAALAHTLGNTTEQAYARSDLFERRRALMEEWSSFLLRTSKHPCENPDNLEHGRKSRALGDAPLDFRRFSGPFESPMPTRR